MPTRGAGGRLFRSELHPQTLKDVEAWDRDSELAGLLAKLRSHTERKPFFDTWAEALVARHLRRRGCALRFEIPTPNDRRADFEVSREGLRFYLHLKRIDTDRPPHRHLIISSRLRVLERIRRPFIVQVRWHEGLTDEQMQRLVQQAETFIEQARVGEEMRGLDHDGREIGGVRILAPQPPHGGETVSVTIGLPSGFIDFAPRMRRLLSRAHEQFMPRATNMIMICSSHGDDVIDFENALLGTHIERWDQFPPRGRRVAHGRASDGFWSGKGFSDSSFAVWACIAPNDDRLHCRMYERGNAADDAAMTSLLKSLFAEDSTDDGGAC
jgi:hypothetical protein